MFLIKTETIADRYSRKENFHGSLVKYNGIDKCVSYIEELNKNQALQNSLDTLNYIKLCSQFVKDRFYHGVSAYQYNENWVAVVFGIVIWGHVLVKLDPVEVLKDSVGLCSQQTTVFIELLKRKGIKTRTVGLGYKEGPGHFLAEVYYMGGWHLYDVNMEPKWGRIKNHHLGMEFYMQNKDTLYKAYEGLISKEDFYKIMEKVKYGEPNEFPAKKMKLFHRIAFIMSYTFPFLFLVLAYLSYRKAKSKDV